MGRRSRELYTQDSHSVVRDPQTGAVTIVAVLPKVDGGGVQACLRKQEKSLINSLTSHLEKLEDEKQKRSYLIEGKK